MKRILRFQYNFFPLPAVFFYGHSIFKPGNNDVAFPYFLNISKEHNRAIYNAGACHAVSDDMHSFIASLQSHSQPDIEKFLRLFVDNSRHAASRRSIDRNTIVIVLTENANCSRLVRFLSYQPLPFQKPEDFWIAPTVTPTARAISRRLGE